MENVAHSVLSSWESFYVIVGSSAAALTGLQFVVMALISESKRRSTTREIDAFGTPTIVHFCAVLLIAAVLSAPWREFQNVSWILTLCGIGGLIYGGIVLKRARRQGGYRPLLEDWIWHVVLPLIAYAALLIGAFNLRNHAEPSLFVVGGAALLLLIVGIHNAWDTVTFIVISDKEKTFAETAGDGT